MSAKFGILKENVTVPGFYRPNLHIDIIPCEEKSKFRQLKTLLSSRPLEPTIIYVTLQNTAETVANALTHSEVDATIALGMGVDKSDIRQVIHYDLPKSIEKDPDSILMWHSNAIELSLSGGEDGGV